MVIKKLSPSEKFFLFIVINTIFLGGVFALKLFGLAKDMILPVVATVASLEMIYIAISIQSTVNRNTQSLKETEEYMKMIREDEEKSRNALIYMGHQMRSLQHELDMLKKGVVIKQNGNLHTKAHPNIL